MLYVATHQPLYILAGLGAGSLGAVAAYHLFTHVKTRVNVWRDPFGTYDNGGYQVAQSLFAIGTGGWFGAGLYQGQPDTPMALRFDVTDTELHMRAYLMDSWTVYY